MVAALSTRGREQRLALSGGAVAYWDYAPVGGTAPSSSPAPTILMLHGFRGDHHGLLRIIEELPTARIIIPDLPGFGTSEPFAAGEHDIAGYSRFVGEFMAALALGPETVLLGHSFGSIVAAYLAAAHPLSISRLILINPICEPALEGAKGLMTRLAEFYYYAAARLPEPLGMALLRNRIIVRVMSITMAKTTNKDLRRWIHGQHDAYFSIFANRQCLLEAFRASIGATVREVARELTMPVLLIVGTIDDLGSVPGQRRMAAMIPDSTLRIIDDVGHLIHYEAPAEAAAMISGFLAEAPA